MELSVIQADNQAVALQCSDSVFDAAYNEPLVHQIVTAYLAGARAGTKAQLTRAEVQATGAKPWRQKGTGRARAGTVSSPIWRSGGVSFAAKPRDYSQKVNRKMYRAGIRAIVSELVRQERLVVVETLNIDAPKTKQFVAELTRLGLTNSKLLVVLDSVDSNVYLAARNVPRVAVIDAQEIEPVSLISFEKVVITARALKQLEERLS